ncbi:hypothetical protein LL946_04795 [Knoellia locipacati]|uniref:hypothetical protein n=1 Tax=Knoellia locipacati TaxID=882824 RepID=UPI00384A90BD
MTRTPRAQVLIDLAQRHLDAAAETAQHSSPDQIPGAAFAGQIRLAAAALPTIDEAVADGPPLPAADVATHLRDALTALDQIAPFDGPPDLPLCAWHVHELFRIATRTGAA